MAAYDFDRIIPREGTNSVKWSPAKAMNPLLPDDYIPMWIADMDFACPPPVLDAMHARLDREILGYSTFEDPAYFEAVTGWLKRRHGLAVDPERIAFSAGVVSALKAAVADFTKPGDSVLINTPGYAPFYHAIVGNGRTPVFSPLKRGERGYEVDFDDFERKAADPAVTMFILCSPHNPTGRVWREDELRRMADICFKNGLFIVSDEIHNDLVRVGKKHIPLATLYPEQDRILTCTAPSKTFNLAGNQLSNIIMPDAESAQRWAKNHMCGSPNPLAIDACRAAYNECEDWLEQLKVYLDGNFAFLCEFVQNNLKGVKAYTPEGTYLAWVDFSGCGCSDKELSDRIARAGVLLEYSGEFIADDEGCVRMNLACPRSVLKTALERIKSAL